MNSDALKDVSLTTIKGGAAVELFDHELHRVIENIVDPNTEAEEVREITLKVTIKPSGDRDTAVYTVTAKANKLAGPKGVGGQVYLGRRMGAMVAVEHNPEQIDIFDPEAGADITPISKARKEGTTS